MNIRYAFALALLLPVHAMAAVVNFSLSPSSSFINIDDGID